MSWDVECIEFLGKQLIGRTPQHNPEDGLKNVHSSNSLAEASACSTSPRHPVYSHSIPCLNMIHHDSSGPRVCSYGRMHSKDSLTFVQRGSGIRPSFSDGDPQQPGPEAQSRKLVLSMSRRRCRGSTWTHRGQCNCGRYVALFHEDSLGG